MSEIDAVGDLAQGALTARALEPAAGEGVRGGVAEADGHTHERACLNCGTPLVGPHCHGCGQAAHVHRTLGAFFHDLLHGVLHFEGKIWRTLPMLAFRPGRLTREYIDGRRATYVSPIALFLFTIFLTFAAFNALGGTEAITESLEVDAARQLNEAYKASEAELAKLERQAADPDFAVDDRAELRTEIEAARKQRDSLRGLVGSGPGGGSTFSTRLDQAGPTDGTARSLGKRLRAAWDKAQANPQLLLYKLQSNAYKFAWLLIPLSVPFVWLTFAWRRGFGVYDHTIFTTYSITFMIALLFAMTLTSNYLSGGLGIALLLYAPVHMYWQLRGTYGLSRFGALWRLVALSAFAWIAIALFAALLLLLSD